MASIKKLLSKKGWTGKDVGKTLIACLLHDLKQIDEDNAAPLLTQAEYERIESSLCTERDFTTYRVYVAIHEALREFYNKANSSLQQVYHGLYRIIPVIGNYLLAEKEERKSKNILHLTIEQYKEVEERVKRTKSQKVRTKNGVMFALLRAYLGMSESEYKAAIPDHIQKELNAIAKKPATNKQALKAWQEAAAIGGLCLPDGRYKEDMTPDELKEALAQYAPIPGLKKQNDGQEAALYYEGAEAIRSYYKEVAGEDLPPMSDEALLFVWHSNIGVPAQDDFYAVEGIDSALYETVSNKLGAVLEGNKDYAFAWKYYPIEDIEKPTKREILEYHLEYYEGEPRAFKKDYPALYAALEKEILSTIPAWQELTPAQLSKATITSGELAKIGFLDFAEQIAATSDDVRREYPGYIHTIALVQDASFSDLDADLMLKDNPLILQAYKAEELIKDGAEDIKAAIELLILPAMRFVYAYNAWIDIIEAVYDVPDMQIAKADTQSVEARFMAMNKLIYRMYLDADNAQERAAIKQAFMLMPVDLMHPQEDNINEVAQEIASYGYTQAAAKSLNLVNTNATIKRIAGL